MWQIMVKLSERYKIVILGERQIEMNKGYLEMEDKKEVIYLY